MIQKNGENNYSFVSLFQCCIETFTVRENPSGLQELNSHKPGKGNFQTVEISIKVNCMKSRYISWQGRKHFLPLNPNYGDPGALYIHLGSRSPLYSEYKLIEEPVCKGKGEEYTKIVHLPESLRAPSPGLRLPPSWIFLITNLAHALIIAWIRMRKRKWQHTMCDIRRENTHPLFRRKWKKLAFPSSRQDQ